jgi:hypothetical protein
MSDTHQADWAFSYMGAQSCSYAVPDLKHWGRVDAPAFARNVK